MKKYNYFIYYVLDNGNKATTTIDLTYKIDSIEKIRNIEEKLEKFIKLNKKHGAYKSILIKNWKVLKITNE